MRNSRQAIEKRRSRILKLLEFRESMSVEELADELKTLCNTIRRDLQYFSDQNLIDRHHGGASLNKNKLYDQYIHQT